MDGIDRRVRLLKRALKGKILFVILHAFLVLRNPVLSKQSENVELRPTKLHRDLINCLEAWKFAHESEKSYEELALTAVTGHPDCFALQVAYFWDLVDAEDERNEKNSLANTYLREYMPLLAERLLCKGLTLYGLYSKSWWQVALGVAVNARRNPAILRETTDMIDARVSLKVHRSARNTLGTAVFLPMLEDMLEDSALHRAVSDRIPLLDLGVTPTFLLFFFYAWLHFNLAVVCLAWLRTARCPFARRRMSQKPKKKAAVPRKTMVAKTDTSERILRQTEPGWFFHACLYGHKDHVRDLLQRKAVGINLKCEYGGNTGLHLACATGSLSTVQVLLDNHIQKV